jgi:hypothetical protein
MSPKFSGGYPESVRDNLFPDGYRDMQTLFFVEVTGVEPVTFCMPCKRSSQLS